jgi:putative intracellular protease/amidase/uncharacterized protein (DUF952 family)
MRWLYHLTADARRAGDRYAPASLAGEGFIHCSYRDEVAESARRYFPAGATPTALAIDPRRLDVPVVVADTPRGPMPHVHGAVPVDAIRGELTLDALADAPDAVTGARVAFVAFDGLTLLDLVGVYDPLSRIASMGFDATTTVEVIGAQQRRAWAADGAALTVERVRPPLDGFDLLVIPGGLGTRALVRDERVMAWLATWPAHRLTASVCTGSLVLGALGRLQGRRATTHPSARAELAAHGAVASNERVVDAGQLVTAGGVTAGIDLGLHLAARLMGDEVAQKIAAQMDWRSA